MPAKTVKFTFQWKLNDQVFPESSRVFKCVFNNFAYSFNLFKSQYNGAHQKALIISYVEGLHEQIEANVSFQLIDAGPYFKYPLFCSMCQNRTDKCDFELINLKKNIWYTPKPFNKHDDYLSSAKYGFIISCMLVMDVEMFKYDVDEPKFDAPPELNVNLFESTFDETAGVDHYFSDITLTSSEGETFRCHKSCLAAGSEYLRKLLNDKKLTDNNLQIDNVKSAVLREVLRFIYTCKVEAAAVKPMAVDLVDAAEKFELPKLKQFCLCLMLELIDVDIKNVVKYLIAAHRHGFEEGKRKAISIINQNSSEVQNTEEWSTLKKDFPHLMIEILNDAVERMNVLVEHYD